MELPKPKELVDVAGISPSYASMILSDEPDKRRNPPLPLAGCIFRELRWKHPSVAELSDDTLLDLAAKYDRDRQQEAA